MVRPEIAVLRFGLGVRPVLSKSRMSTPDVDEDFLDRLADLYSKDDWFSARLSEAIQVRSCRTAPKA
jgi:hypothetical protein